MLRLFQARAWISIDKDGGLFIVQCFDMKGSFVIH
jgi:hypothetical protein